VELPILQFYEAERQLYPRANGEHAIEVPEAENVLQTQ
jgi:hypothetical protein